MEKYRFIYYYTCLCHDIVAIYLNPWTAVYGNWNIAGYRHRNVSGAKYKTKIKKGIAILRVSEQSQNVSASRQDINKMRL